MKNSIEKLKKEALVKLKKIEAERGVAEIAAKTGVPYSTIAGWLWRSHVPAKRIDLIDELYEQLNKRGKNGNHKRNS